MKLTSINAGLFKLDGGAMFGVVPKKIWSKLITPDANNLCTWSMRCLLIEMANRKILIDCGMGNKQDTKFFSHYEPHGSLLFDSLAQQKINAEDITDVFLTHLHFDHCGGAVQKTEEGQYIPSFPNAIYWSNKAQWDWASNPNSREKASFLKENFIPLAEHGVLKFVEDQEQEIAPGIGSIWVYGHTESMMLPVIKYGERKIIYMADLLPSAAHIPIPYVMGYDIRPLITLQEKEKILFEAEADHSILFFEHDAENICCNLQKTEKGIRPNQFFNLDSI